MENKPKIENTKQLQAKPHFRSSVDHEANHTSGQRPVMRTVTKNVTRHLMIIDKNSSWCNYGRFRFSQIWHSNEWGIPENSSIERADFVPKTWVGTNCVCELFQPLREFKLLKFGFRSKTFCLDFIVLNWGYVIGIHIGYNSLGPMIKI